MSEMMIKYKPLCDSFHFWHEQAVSQSHHLVCCLRSKLARSQSTHSRIRSYSMRLHHGILCRSPLCCAVRSLCSCMQMDGSRQITVNKLTLNMFSDYCLPACLCVCLRLNGLTFKNRIISSDL